MRSTEIVDTIEACQNEDGKLRRGRVDQALFELYHHLLAKWRGVRSGRLLIAAGTAGVFAISGAPNAVAEPLVTCISDVIDGVEVDNCVGNPNANTVTDVPGVNVDFEFSLGIGFGF